MRDLSCYLSSVSIHAFAVAMITAAGVMQPPDFAVTSGGVSITGSSSQVEIETQVDFKETSVESAEPAADPFRVPVSNVAPAEASKRKPQLTEVSTPQSGLRTTSEKPIGLVETLVIPREGLLERIGDEPMRPQPGVALAQIDQESREAGEPAEDTSEQNSAPLREDSESKPQETPARKAEAVSEKPASSKEITKPRNDASRPPEKPAKNGPRKNSAAPAALRENSESKPQKKSSATDPASRTQKISRATPSSNEPSGAKVDQLPQELPSNRSPDYPKEAWQKQQEGVVYLLVRVTASGRAESVRVYRSSGFGLLDSAAKKAVRAWKFQPASRRGKAVGSPVVVPVRFQIQRQSPNAA